VTGEHGCVDVVPEDTAGQTLHTAELADGASAAVIVSRAADRAAFVAADLPALSADKIYELW
jgi:hypothetical protein